MPTGGDAAAQGSELERVCEPNLEGDPVGIMVREELWVSEGLEEGAADALVDLRVDLDGDLEGESERPFERDDDPVLSIVRVEEALFEEEGCVKLLLVGVRAAVSVSVSVGRGDPVPECVTLSDRDGLSVVEGEEGRVSDALVDLRVDLDGDLEGDSERSFERDSDPVSSIVGVEEALFEGCVKLLLVGVWGTVSVSVFVGRGDPVPERVNLSDRDGLGVVEGEEGRVSDALVDLRVDLDGELEGDSERSFE